MGDVHSRHSRTCRHDIQCIDCDGSERSRRYRPSMLVMVAASLIERALDSESHKKDATVACMTYLHKYASKSHGMVTCRRRSAKWHAQARMLSRALPMDVVFVIGAHVRELAAIMLQKFMRGAAVRLAWGLPGLCDEFGNLVYL